MTTEQILALQKNRLTTLQDSPKNLKSTGVVRKLRRRIRNLENK
jgi:hypothetical protein